MVLPPPPLCTRQVVCCDLPADHPDSFAALEAAGRAQPHTLDASVVAPEDLVRRLRARVGG